jgi:hypothetical protein
MAGEIKGLDKFSMLHNRICAQCLSDTVLNEFIYYILLQAMCLKRTNNTLIPVLSLLTS